MIDKKLRTSDEWQKEVQVEVLDPDGWDRGNFRYSWYEELITQKEFERRCLSSTCMGHLLQDNVNKEFWK